MSLVQVKEIYTPLLLLRIRVFRDQHERKFYIKVLKRSIKRLFA
ncbi:hypothetical protein [Metabacillus halosaccharovorans]